jgi:flagellar basal body-associated protein FliL
MARWFGFALAALALIVFATSAEAGGRSRPAYERLEGGPYYMQLERIVVPKFQADGVSKIFSYSLVLEFADAEARDRAKTIMPKLMDAYIHDLHVLTSRPGSGENGADPTVAKRYLLQSSKRILGEEAVKDVLIERTLARKTG